MRQGKVDAPQSYPSEGARPSGEGSPLRRQWQQFHEETLAWLRSLEFLRQENSHLKNRLAEVVDGSTDRDFLAQAEHFQNQFIIKDEYLDEIRHDVNGQERSLQGQARRRETGMDELLRQVQRRLRGQMDYLEREFTGLRNEFNDYIDGRL
jgi:hypothetical protein